MNELVEEQEQSAPVAVADWYTAWLPKPVARLEAPQPQPEPMPMTESPAIETTPEVMEVPVPASPIDEVRSELKAVSQHLLDPSEKGIRASLPHLERAVNVFGSYVKMKELPILEPALESLRAELALATMLFENAYTLQAGWAAQIGLNLDGTPKQLLYSRPGESQPAPALASAGQEWEG